MIRLVAVWSWTVLRRDLSESNMWDCECVGVKIECLGVKYVCEWERETGNERGWIQEEYPTLSNEPLGIYDRLDTCLCLVFLSSNVPWNKTPSNVITPPQYNFFRLVQ